MNYTNAELDAIERNARDGRYGNNEIILGLLGDIRDRDRKLRDMASDVRRAVEEYF